jgi:hypothetical protein
MGWGVFMLPLFVESEGGASDELYAFGGLDADPGIDGDGDVDGLEGELEFECVALRLAQFPEDI